MCAADAAIIAHAQERGLCNTIVVNRTWELLPSADVLYAADHQFYATYIAGIRPHFKGELWTQDKGWIGRKRWGDVARDWGLHVVTSIGGAGLHPDPETVYQHGNSGAQAICLAVLFGARRIVLSGFDMQRTASQSHWHGDHVASLSNGNPTSFIRHFETLAPELVGAGVIVLNCSRSTALTCFLRAELAETLR